MPDLLADPTTTQWVAAWVAAGLVVLLLGVHLLLPVLRRSTATPWGRTAGLALAMLAAGLVLCVVVVGVAATRVDDGVEQAAPFTGVLVDVPPPEADARAVDAAASRAERVAAYVAALGLPLAGVLGVLALAVVAVGRPSGLRAAAGAASGVLLVVGLLLATGETGTVPRAVGWTVLVLAAVTAAALVADELTGRTPADSGR